MRDWREVRQTKTRNDRSCSMFAWLVGKYLLDHPYGSEPEALRNARAREYALARLPLHEEMCDEFWGGPATCYRIPYAAADFVVPGASYKECAAAYGATTRSFASGVNHTVPDYEMVILQGLGGFIERAEAEFARDPAPYREAMLISLRALSDYMVRAATFCESFHPEAARRLRKVATERPETLAEGVQLVITVQDMLLVDNGYANALGRLDQYLYPLYKADEEGREQALDMMCHLMMIVDRYHEITNIAIGGVKADGTNGENELSLLILKAVDAVHSPSTNLSARLHDGSSKEFLQACVRLIATGIGFPAVFNDNINITMLVDAGIPLEAARDYALVGCVETVVAGRQVPWGDGRFNMPEIFCDVVRRLAEFDTYEAVVEALKEGISKGLMVYRDNYLAGLAAYPPEKFPMPLLSALTRDCIMRGLDVNDGGAEFPRFHGVGMMGLATLADSLAVVKKLVFEEKRITAQELVEAVESDFQGHEELRQLCLNQVPKYGNDDDYVDSIAAEIVAIGTGEAVAMGLPCGGRIFGCMASNVQNVSAGAQTPATPDGRHAGAPLSDAASPSGGRDREGPTAFVNSIIKPDYTAQNCTVVNMRFTPEMFKGEEGVDRMVALLRRFVSGGGHEMQFNVTDNAVLEAAIANPEEYGDLIVRVSGFSDYFINLAPGVQRDILRRSIHGAN
ncbi:MAG: hypothetical protein GX230_01310 [Lentisphaerae bacterium]|nr:hypothetical protein [Lentisphaerota bacterium]